LIKEVQDENFRNLEQRKKDLQLKRDFSIERVLEMDKKDIMFREQ